MAAGAYYRSFQPRRLRLLLALFFIALAVPAGALIWQAYSQLKWEAFHQYRSMAEELTRRINADLGEAVASAEARSFSDYSFLVVGGAIESALLQPSPLSTYPVPQQLPGTLGYFQVDDRGGFSTPLLPPAGRPAQAYGLSPASYSSRQALADRLREILGNNRLVERRAGAELAGVHLSDEGEPERDAPPAYDSQLAFDQLATARPMSDLDGAASPGGAASTGEAQAGRARDQGLGKVADLNLDSALQRKSEARELAEQPRANAPSTLPSPARIARKEQISIVEAMPEAAASAAAAGAADMRIRTFESEIDPLEFSRLDSGHFVLFRKVWRENQRFIQGLLLGEREFIAGAIESPFQDTALSGMSQQIVAYRDNVLSTTSGGRGAGYAHRAGELDGELLLRSRLVAPFDDIELIYTINQLPPGPGATVLAWVSLVLVLVLFIGCYALYRLGLGQLKLARQQQDFVSAVSHELKTPLTSIRMYGEMLKEGWAAPDKKQAYYEFIHDESERLSRLIHNVLQLANISRERPQLDLKTVSVAEVLADITARISTLVERAGFELEIQADPETGAALIRIDRDYFVQIITNLVDNAIKFSHRAACKRIEIGVRRETNARVVFRVRDFGPGIPRDQMRRIFEMFYRSENELNRETAGTGIGLAIVQQLSAAMGATVDVLNREPGAEFRLTVSLAPEPAPG